MFYARMKDWVLKSTDRTIITEDGHVFFTCREQEGEAGR